MAINILELFATLAMDASNFDASLVQAQRQADKFKINIEKIMSAIGKATAVGLGAAATGVGAMIKQATSAYGEYEQLVGGVETLFGDSADTIVQKAQNAFKTAQMSANQYLSTVTSFSASLINSIADNSKKLSDEEIEQRQDALDEQYEMQEDYYDDVYDNQKEAYDKQYNLLKDQIDEEIEAVQKANSQKLKELQATHEREIEDFEKLTDKKIALINEEYTESIKLIDKEEYDRIKAIDAQIAKINKQAEAEQKAVEQEEQARKIAELQYQAENAKTASKRRKAADDLANYLAQLEKKENDDKRKAQIEDLKNQKENIKDEAKAKREAAKEERDTKVSAIKETSNEQLKVLKAAQKDEEDALKEQNDKELKLLKKAKDEELDALKNSNGKKLSELKEHNKKALKELQASIKEQKKALESGIDESVSTSVDMQAVYAQAAELADVAIVDMADNANKMGTSMEAIQNAYNGFAKDNYTMLDNLKLGFGGTKTEMQRLIEKATKLDTSVKKNDLSFANIVKAIHAVQKDIYISGISWDEYSEIVSKGIMKEDEARLLLGTSMKEAATTLQGSLAMTKAAWDNLLTGMGNPDADFDQLVDNLVESSSSLLSNLTPIVERAFKSLGNFISKAAPIISKELPKLVKLLLPDLINTAYDLLVGLADALPELFPVLVDTVWQLFNEIADKMGEKFPVLEPVFDILKSALSLIAAVGDSAGAALKAIWDNFLKYVVEFYGNAFMEFMKGFADILDRVSKSQAAVATLTTIIGLITSLTAGIKAYHTVMTLVQTIQTAVATSGGILNAVWAANPVGLIVVALGALIAVIIEVITYWDYMVLIWNTFADEWTRGIQKIGRDFQGLIDNIVNGWNWFWEQWRHGSDTIWQNVTNAFSKVGEFFGGLWNDIVSTFSDIGIKVGEAIGGAFKDTINGVIWTVEGAINAIPNAINGMIDTINNLPGVSISAIPTVTLPRLAQGGVLKKGQVGYLEGDGDEAVVPLSKNTEWIDRVADKIGEKSGNSATYIFNFNIDNVSGNREDIEENADLLMQIFTEKMSRRGVVFA